MTTTNNKEIWLGCRALYTPFRHLENQALRIVNGTIAEIVALEEAAKIAGPRLSEENAEMVAPGFIELHVHGAQGRDLMDGRRESLEAISSTLAAHGTTAFLATTLSAPDSETLIALQGYANHYFKIMDGAQPIGIHMEGPFLNPLRKGTHDSRYLRPTDLRSFRKFLEVSKYTVKKMTVAPEMDDGLQLIKEAVEQGIQISIGHSDATADQAKAAIDAGARQATHIFNAMRPFHQREPGILGHVLTDDRVYAEVIADGVHVHPTALKLLLRAKGTERTMLITDGLSAVGMPEGQYPLGDKMIQVRDGACRDPDGTLAGSVLTLDRAVQNVVDWLDVPLHEALAMASAIPARSMGLGSKKGTIAPGADADLVFLDGNLRVIKTMVAGRIVYQS